MQVKYPLYAFLLSIFALLALYFYFSQPPRAGTRSAPHRPADAWLADPRAMRQATPGDPAQADRVKAGAGVPLSTQVDLLIASGVPADAYRAYWLVQACVDIAESGAPLQTLGDDERQAQKALCGGMTERIKMSRLDHLAIAARAGVSGADGEFLRAGPFGDLGALKTRPDDPLVKAWRVEAEQLLRMHAEAGDVKSMLTLMQEYVGGGLVLDADPALALRYSHALSAIFQRMLNRSNPDFPNAYKVLADNAMKQISSAEQVDTAIAAGNAMADKAAQLQAKNRTDVGDLLGFKSGH